MNAQAQTSTLSGSRLDNRRMLAALIDLALVGAGGAAILAAGGDGLSLGAPLAGVALCWALYYYFACESGGGQTLGKKLMKLRVVREDGRPAGMREIGIRTVLRLVDTALVGLIAMLATGERRARLGDLAAGTTIVSTEAAAPAVQAAAVVEQEPETAEETDADTHEEADSFGDEAAEAGSAAPYEPITRFDPSDDVPDITSPALSELAQDIAATGAPDEAAPAEEPEPVVEIRATEPEPVAEIEPVVEIRPVADAEPLVEIRPVEDAEPVVEREPLVEVDVGGPEIDVDGPDLTVRSVETVSAIDLVMGADAPSEDRPAADEPPAGA
ncbi:MAG TPA: RDD family protein [Thermoleophilaceae bacterium]|nr:RDD family protein [Thermoleophilaceae bacterium]